MNSYFIYFKEGNNVKFIRRERSEWQRRVAGLGAGGAAFPASPSRALMETLKAAAAGVKTGPGGDVEGLRGHVSEGGCGDKGGWVRWWP